MSFPLPRDTDFIKEVVGFWLDDVDDRIQVLRLKDAEYSWLTARDLYLTLPPGTGDEDLESRISATRVKLDNVTNETNENTL